MNEARPTIFVAIASYSDPELPRTLDDCLATARYPENLRFGICWQYDTAAPIELSRFRSDRRFCFSDYRVEDSQGGSWARNVAQAFYDGETYALQVDSHTAFAPGWDSSLVSMMRTLPADKPLITMIAPLFRVDDDGTARKRTEHGVRCGRLADWNETSGWTPWFDWGQAATRRQTRNRFISGCFIFTIGPWTEEVRQDPDHYYWGEEFALTLRSYTHGYDFFLPDSIVAWHMEHTEAPPRRHWEHGTEVISAKNKVAFERFRKLAFSDDPSEQESLGRFGLGPRRTLAEYERFAGIDLTNKRAHPDVYAGRSPDPVTIRKDDDWADCITCEEYLQTVESQGKTVWPQSCPGESGAT